MSSVDVVDSNALKIDNNSKERPPFKKLLDNIEANESDKVNYEKNVEVN